MQNWIQMDDDIDILPEKDEATTEDEEDHESNNELVVEKKITDNEAIKCLNIALQYAQNVNENWTDVVVLKKLRDNALIRKMKRPVRQTMLSEFFQQ